MLNLYFLQIYNQLVFLLKLYLYSSKIKLIRMKNLFFTLLGFFGMFISLIVSYVISAVLFEGTYKFDVWTPVLALAGISLVSLFVAYWASRNVVKEKPLAILQTSVE
jgi:hypothetical protein